MKHAVLGAGGVGGLVAALLADAGEDVTVLVRPQAAHPERMILDRPSGQIVAPVRIATSLPDAVDVLWITVKATQFEAALAAVPAHPDSPAAVVPLLNGVDHVARLRQIFGGHVVPATIAVEAERLAPGHVAQRSPFVRLALSTAAQDRLAAVAEHLRRRGVECQFVADETTLMWSKLCFLAPLALATTAAGRTTSEILGDPEWAEQLRAAAREACAVAVAEGAAIDAAKIAAVHASLPPGMRSSMQKDVASGRAPELDAIAGPILRGGRKHGIPTPACSDLVRKIEAKLA